MDPLAKFRFVYLILTRRKKKHNYKEKIDSFNTDGIGTINLIWCEWRESNPHAQRAQDFKSRLSAYSNTLARKLLYMISGCFVKKKRKKSRGFLPEVDIITEI